MTRWETRRGTGSGAEQRVPIYVAIGASLALAYGTIHHRSGQSSGMALAIFDEAFSKMDGKNQRQMMQFYRISDCKSSSPRPLKSWSRCSSIWNHCGNRPTWRAIP
jgi:uncharacterized protein YPO0396